MIVRVKSSSERVSETVSVVVLSDFWGVIVSATEVVFVGVTVSVPSSDSVNVFSSEYVPFKLAVSVNSREGVIVNSTDTVIQAVAPGKLF